MVVAERRTSIDCFGVTSSVTIFCVSGIVIDNRSAIVISGMSHSGFPQISEMSIRYCGWIFLARLSHIHKLEGTTD